MDFQNIRPGPYCFKIRGQIYYQINTSLYSAQNELPNCRLSRNPDLNAEILRDIDNAMRQYNVLAESYKMMKEEIESMRIRNNNEEPEMQLLFTLKKGSDRRRYNFQRVNEVATVFSITTNGKIPESYVTIYNKDKRELQFVSSMNDNVEPWTYPLFYPLGTKGWHDDIPQVTGSRKGTRNAYFKYRMTIRDDEVNYVVKGRRLFQQWIVDSYVKIERDRMNYFRRKQSELRVDSYQGLIEHLQNLANDTNTRIGKIFILPSTFVGSPRYMKQTYQDAITIVREYGKPDLFITMTCNLKWVEITENLSDGQIASDRPDLVTRVFE
ncbi:uncharacterized protein LOC135164547 [Diachasmimorpha longicaudata]|uniref:uncharacterized protein LOC135164547 n=1 Tax=Diachasmimorpha longicaudata TaxID=58733 RepID=UPI0030B86C7F